VADKQFLADLSKVDFDHIVADIEGIRQCNPQRYEMEQLTAVVYENLEERLCIGYKDIGPDEFWARGHMPGMPLMPGVIMLEGAAQMCSYFVQKHKLFGDSMVGFGGLDEVRFRDPVLPGNRLIYIGLLTKVRAGRMLVSRFQGIVNNRLAVEGVIKGVPIPVDAIKALTEG